jgi:hypothetical protein
MVPRSSSFLALAAIVTSVALPAAAEARPASDGSPGQPGAPSVNVEVTSTASGEVLARFEHPSGRGDAERVCRLPCKATLPGDGATYRVVGMGLTPSPPFTLPTDATDVTVHARPGRWRRFATGLTLTIMGGTYAPLGGVFAAMGVAEEGRPDTKAILPVGVGFLIGGVALLGVGLPILLSNRTEVDIDSRRVTSGVHLVPGGLVF